MELMQASQQWMLRPDDERFTNLHEMKKKMHVLRDNSRERSTSLSQVMVKPTDAGDLRLTNGEHNGASLTNWSFGQIAALSGAPASYLRKLPAEMAADCLNWGMKFGEERHKEVKWLFTKDDDVHARAANGSRYGRIWNEEIVDVLTSRFGDGVSGKWRVPGVFGERVTVTKDNTTLYAGDRDMFVFLADESAIIPVKNRRRGEEGALSRGFFVWNSEVGSATFGMAMFLYDYVCANRIVWGATEYREVKLRHTTNAPDRWARELTPMLLAYSQGSSQQEAEKIAAAQAKKLDDPTEFLAKRFSKSMADRFQSVHMIEEQRPIETVWDAVTGITAYARGLNNQDNRVAVERDAGKLLEMV